MPLLINNRQKIVKLPLRSIRSSMTKAINCLKCRDREISLILVDDPGITVINAEYLGRNRPTNVISFSMQEGEWGEIQPALLGDIVISVETALRDSLSNQIDLEDEILFLFIHGLLHLLGYDHENGNETDADLMKAREKEVFSSIKGYELDHD